MQQQSIQAANTCKELINSNSQLAYLVVRVKFSMEFCISPITIDIFVIGYTVTLIKINQTEENHG